VTLKPESSMQLPPTPLQARGVSGTWATGLALVICIAMIIGLLSMIIIGGSKTFWQRPLEQISLTSGDSLIGMKYRTEVQPDGTGRSLYRVGNRDLGQQPFRWISDTEIESIEIPNDAVLVERQEWGVWIGIPERIYRIDETGEKVFAADTASSWDVIDEHLILAEQRRDEIERIRSGPIAALNDKLEHLRLGDLNAQMNAARKPRAGRLSWPLWSALAVVLLASGFTATRVNSSAFRRIFVLAAVLSLLAMFTERPWAKVPWTADRLNSFITESASERDVLAAEFTQLNQRLSDLESENAAYRIDIRDVHSDRLAPISRSLPNDSMKISQILRAVRPSELSTVGKVKLYLARWWEFLWTNPREANTEGGVFPVIIGTLIVTLMLTVAVVPLGVLAALYMREYAKQGIVVSVLRVAINNLAGVPSIVYGVFGLGFFCYGLGGVIDGGTDASFMLKAGQWWVLVLVLAGLLFVTLTLTGNDGKHKKGLIAAVLWTGVAGLTVAAIFSTPYFEGFFRAKLIDGAPTFGTSGLLWASLTLALLTLPVVIVSAEEAIAAVPASLREGSYGCGASKWQTIQRVVLPGAMPGIMTGAILAMARGAGEVAPLMIVGAVKLAPKLPIEGEFPFLYADRSFMHLGFHIFDLAFKSPDSEAARGFVWTTTLLLVTLVVLMNLVAIRVRARLRAKFQSGQF
jgi:ABC-type phosphate transport system permease subunit